MKFFTSTYLSLLSVYIYIANEIIAYLEAKFDSIIDIKLKLIFFSIMQRTKKQIGIHTIFNKKKHVTSNFCLIYHLFICFVVYFKSSKTENVQ